MSRVSGGGVWPRVNRPLRFPVHVDAPEVTDDAGEPGKRRPDPTPEEIAALTAQIRRTWTVEEEAKRWEGL